ncbi:helix-turn-helix domain-containing protein [Streptomyces sp. NBC_01180]|uniref:helix-turn-helix domain-containing protein n=1 Tax=Streptomyces sp. NBC_01180 TaxID=2903763 RepID=UPI00386331DD|nr:helix-turn-helix domain-containing protein [Streptomyces sp. NBC_01180]
MAEALTPPAPEPLAPSPLSADPLSPDPAHDVTLDAAALRVLAHPVRLNLLSRLRQYGPATARQLAAHFALDPGSASYHLRRLAAGGLIEEDSGRGTRRDRWWQARHRTSFHDPGANSPPEQADSRAYAQALLLAYSDQLRRLAGTVPLLPDDWYAASVFSDYTLHLTPDELNAMKAELVEVVSRYRGLGPGRPQHGADDADGAGAAAGAPAVPGAPGGPAAPTPVSVQLQSFPLLDR